MKPLWEPNQLAEDLRDRFHELRLLDAINGAEAKRIGRSFKLGLILVTYDRTGSSELADPAWCIAKETCSFQTILQTLKHLA